MKNRSTIKPIYYVLLLVAILVSACGTQSTPTEPSAAAPPTAEPADPAATETQAPTEAAPATSGDPVWDRVQSTGKIVFGTSADYAPFEYYDSNFQIIGFDAALAREVASRLGLQIEIKDIAFEGLQYALQTGQIDAAIAALSVTPNRQAVMDFTNVYYSGQDMVLARKGTGIANIVAPAQLGQYRVGVERGSVYQTWIQTTLVDAGLMPSANLFTYEKPEHAVRDLRGNLLDVVVMDRLPADEYLLEGNLEAVGEGLNTQLYAIALQKGASTLQSNINDVLIQLQNDGRIAELSKEYLQIDVSQYPLSLPTPAPADQASTANAGACDGMEYVADVNIPDHTVMDPGRDFDKTWRIKNTGTCTWDNSYRFVFVQGDRMNGDTVNVRGTVRPGETYDVTIDQTAPNNPGNYGGVWGLVNGQGTAFGTRVWVKIRVKGEAQGGSTDVQPYEPPQGPPPVISSFELSPADVSPGGTVTLSWSFSGEGLAAARLTRTNPDGTQTPLNGGVDVAMQGSLDDQVTDVGTYIYSLSVSSETGGTVVQTVSVTVNKKSK